MRDGKTYNLDQLIESVGEGEDLNRMLEIFTDSTPKILDDLNKSYYDYDIVGIANAAHKLKATIDMLDIKELQKIIREMSTEHAVINNKHSLPKLLSKTNKVMNQVLTEIQLSYLVNKKV